MNELRVWIGCLACYNAGSLVGFWAEALEADDAVEDFTRRVDWDGYAFRTRTDHDSEAHEEYWVFDHDGFGGFLTGECSPHEAQRIAEGLAQVDDSEREPYSIFLRDRGDMPSAELVEEFREHYRGGYDSEAAFAEEWAHEIGSVNELDPMHAYIDWAYYARDLFIEAFWGQRGSDGLLHVFDRY